MSANTRYRAETFAHAPGPGDSGRWEGRYATTREAALLPACGIITGGSAWVLRPLQSVESQCPGCRPIPQPLAEHRGPWTQLWRWCPIGAGGHRSGFPMPKQPPAAIRAWRPADGARSPAFTRSAAHHFGRQLSGAATRSFRQPRMAGASASPHDHLRHARHRRIDWTNTAASRIIRGSTQINSAWKPVGSGSPTQPLPSTTRAPALMPAAISVIVILGERSSGAALCRPYTDRPGPAEYYLINRHTTKSTVHWIRRPEGRSKLNSRSIRRFPGKAP